MNTPLEKHSGSYALNEYEILRKHAIEMRVFPEANPQTRSRLWNFISRGMAAWLDKKHSKISALSNLPPETSTKEMAKPCSPELLIVLTDMALSNIQSREASCIVI